MHVVWFFATQYRLVHCWPKDITSQPQMINECIQTTYLTLHELCWNVTTFRESVQTFFTLIWWDVLKHYSGRQMKYTRTTCSMQMDWQRAKNNKEQFFLLCGIEIDCSLCSANIVYVLVSHLHWKKIMCKKNW